MRLDDALPLFIFGGLLLPVLGLAFRRLNTRRRQRFIDAFDYTALLDGRLARRRPEFSARQREQVFAGLREWFHVCNLAGRRRVSMPSQAVDDAWHEFILFTRNYRHFCRKALGRFLHHVPAEAMASPTQAQEGIRRSWKLACRREAIDPRAASRLPLLFAIDAELGIADGFRYQLDCRSNDAGGVYCAGHIGCSSGCGSGCSTDGGSDGGSGCGSGCGGD